MPASPDSHLRPLLDRLYWRFTWGFIGFVLLLGVLERLGWSKSAIGLTFLLGTLAVALATINVVGGYAVTDRMLSMFKKKDKGGAQ